MLHLSLLTVATAGAAAAAAVVFAALVCRHHRRYQVIPVAGPDGRPIAYVRVRPGHRLVLGSARYSRAVIRGRMYAAPHQPQRRTCRPDPSRRRAPWKHPAGWFGRS